MDAEKAISLAGQYGIATVLCVLMVAVLCWVLKWVFDSSNKRETALAGIINNGMVKLADAISDLSKNIQANTVMIQEVSRSMKDGFDSMKRNDDYHRADIKELTDLIKDNECKAK